MFAKDVAAPPMQFEQAAPPVRVQARRVCKTKRAAVAALVVLEMLCVLVLAPELS